ncbi:hypothetical protein A4X17_11445 [Plantibacter sp. H53]|uniref:BRO family protein n=1 Tax=Plantibacter sp. H53 TaxID=1827323 RepID=UPI0007D8DD18|nr:BRO family protein [Plantibacter sp. H53]OAN35089.1 hypothetical protein A4X17_11445 [Plantibacter sp. H53]
MSELNVFSYLGNDVRAIVIDDEPWWVASDVTAALGITNGRNATARLDEAGVRQTDIRSGGQMRAFTIIDEGNLYELVIRSDKPDARAFRTWITRVVLPEIRRTGSFHTAPAPAELSRLDILTMALESEHRAIAAETKVAELEPKAEAFTRFMDSTSFIKIEVAARQAGIGRTTAYRLLRDARILQKFNRAPIQEYAHRFHEVASERVTPAGDLVTEYTTKVRPEHFDWLVSTLERLAGKEGRATA